MIDPLQTQSHSTTPKIKSIPKYQKARNAKNDQQKNILSGLISVVSILSRGRFQEKKRQRIISEFANNGFIQTFKARHSYIVQVEISMSSFIDEKTSKNSYSFGKGMMMLSDSFKRISISQSLRIQFENQAFTGNTLKELGRCLKYLTNIKRINLSFYICEISDTKGFKCLRKSLKSLPCLENFGLTFESPKIHNKEGFAGVIKSLRDLPCFKELTFHFSEITREERKGLPDFCTSLKHLTSLERLDLGFLNCDEITSEVALSLSKSLKCLNSLKSISLHLASCVRNENEDLLTMGLAFSFLHSLETINLNLENYFLYLDDKTLEALSQNWKNLQKLENLTLKISSGHEVTDEGLKDLLANLNIQHQLKNLTLILSPEKLLGEAGMKYLSDYFIANPQLETIDIRSPQNKNLCFGGLEIFAKGIKTLVNLKALKIDLTKSIITNEDFESLAESFQSLTSLQNLSLVFRNCISLDDKSINSLMKNIENLPSLKSLNADFSLTGSLNDEGLKSLSTGLRNLYKLERVDLRLGSKNLEITREGVDHVVQVLKKLSLLHYLSFSIHSEKMGFTKEEIAKWKKELKHIPSLIFQIYGKG